MIMNNWTHTHWEEYLTGLGYRKMIQDAGKSEFIPYIYWVLYEFDGSDGNLQFKIALQVQQGGVDLYLSHLAYGPSGVKPPGFFDFSKYVYEAEITDLKQVLEAMVNPEKAPLCAGIEWAQEVMEVLLLG